MRVKSTTASACEAIEIDDPKFVKEVEEALRSHPAVSRACATSYQSTINVTEAIATGTIECGLAGGADSSSDVPITVSKALQEALIEASKARSIPSMASPSFDH